MAWLLFIVGAGLLIYAAIAPRKEVAGRIAVRASAPASEKENVKVSTPSRLSQISQNVVERFRRRLKSGTVPEAEAVAPESRVRRRRARRPQVQMPADASTVASVTSSPSPIEASAPEASDVTGGPPVVGPAEAAATNDTAALPQVVAQPAPARPAWWSGLLGDVPEPSADERVRIVSVLGTLAEPWCLEALQQALEGEEDTRVRNAIAAVLEHAAF